MNMHWEVFVGCCTVVAITKVNKNTNGGFKVRAVVEGGEGLCRYSSDASRKCLQAENRRKWTTVSFA